MKLIDKDVLVTEIKRLLAFYSKEIEDNKEDPWAMDIAKRDILQEILYFIDTLEVKEVDSEKEKLTWQDIKLLAEIGEEFMNSEESDNLNEEDYYQGILSKFKAQK